VLYLGHKSYTATRHVIDKQNTAGKLSLKDKIHEWFSACVFWTRVEDIDVWTGKKEMDELEKMDVPPVPKNFVEKFWFWLA
jgi:amino acid transporter